MRNLDVIRARTRYHITLGAMLLLAVLLNIVAWINQPFCDAYVEKVFPLWINTYGRLTGLAKGSVGEYMILALILYLLLAVLLLIPRFLCREAEYGAGYYALRAMRGFYGFGRCVFVVVLLIMTLNCTMLYHTASFADYSGMSQSGTYTSEQLKELYESVITKANELSVQMERDDNGDVIYTGDMEADGITYMQALGETYPRLAGFYPRTKTIRNSWFLSQQYMQGYYFPFSMESNINGMMYIMNKPGTICHELAHIKGFIYEDDANFISYLACMNSDNPVFQYSACLQVLPYIAQDVQTAVDEGLIDPYSLTAPTAYVQYDSMFLSDEAWQQVEETSSLDTDTVNEYTDAALDQTLKINGVEEGIESYGRVVQLLLYHMFEN